MTALLRVIICDLDVSWSYPLINLSKLVHGYFTRHITYNWWISVSLFSQKYQKIISANLKLKEQKQREFGLVEKEQLSKMVLVIFITYYRRRPLIVCNKVFASALDTSVQGLWAAAPKAEWRPRRQAAIWCDRRALACGCHSAPLCSPPSVRTKQPLVSLDQPGGQWVLGHLTAS